MHRGVGNGKEGKSLLQPLVTMATVAPFFKKKITDHIKSEAFLKKHMKTNYIPASSIIWNR